MSGAPSSADGAPGTVWALPKAKAGFAIVHLLNLTANGSAAWRDEQATYRAPSELANLRVKLYPRAPFTPGVSRLLIASPDVDHGKASPLPYTAGTDAGGDYVAFVVPRLAYWDMVWLETSALASSTDYDVDARAPLDAASFTDAAPGAGALDGDDGGATTIVGNACCGRWVAYDGVRFDGGVARAELRVASASGGRIELRLDAPDGPVIGAADVAATGGWQTWATTTLAVSVAAGTHRLVMRFPGAPVNVRSLRFE